MIKEGQVCVFEDGVVFVITKSSVRFNHIILRDGWVNQYIKGWAGKGLPEYKVIAEYDNWIDAVNSKEFNNG